jgi:two-component system, cell cycle response regulator
MGATILLVDDSTVLRTQIRSMLEQGLEIDRYLEADDGLKGFKLMIESQPDLVICDLVMPGFDGLKFLSLRATRPELLHVPVLILTAEGDTNRKVEVLDRGASDYVTKPFNEKELIARVRVHLRVKVLQDELRQANARLDALAVTDGLTGLFNRRHFDGLLVNEVKRTLRYKTPLALILIDLDHFKRVNDEHGHAVGDLVLRNVSRAIAESVRATDFVARYGGEELAVILTQTPLAGARDVAERLRHRIESIAHVHDNGTLQRTASFGLAALDGADEPIDPQELVRRADECLYKAKNAGRNRVVVWGS